MPPLPWLGLTVSMNMGISAQRSQIFNPSYKGQPILANNKGYEHEQREQSRIEIDVYKHYFCCIQPSSRIYHCKGQPASPATKGGLIILKQLPFDFEKLS